MFDEDPTAKIEQIEISMENAKRGVAKRDLVQKLRKNAAFREIVEEGYLKGEAVRLVSALGDPSMSSPQNQAAILKDIHAISSFEQYLRTIIQLGDALEREIAEAQEALAEIREGEAE